MPPLDSILRRCPCRFRAERDTRPVDAVCPVAQCRSKPDGGHGLGVGAVSGRDSAWPLRLRWALARCSRPLTGWLSRCAIWDRPIWSGWGVGMIRSAKTEAQAELTLSTVQQQVAPVDPVARRSGRGAESENRAVLCAVPAALRCSWRWDGGGLERHDPAVDSGQSWCR